MTAKLLISFASTLLGIKLSLSSAHSLHYSKEQPAGTAMQSYPQGQAEISAVKITINEGEPIPFHCHPVPTFGYIIKGTIQVNKPGGSSVIFNKGDAVIETMSHQHAGPAELVAFYAGAVDIKTHLLREQRAVLNSSHKKAPQTLIQRGFFGASKFY